MIDKDCGQDKEKRGEQLDFRAWGRVVHCHGTIYSDWGAGGLLGQVGEQGRVQLPSESVVFEVAEGCPNGKI